MSRTSPRYIPLERHETAVLRGASARLAQRRAALEEELAAAVAESDREMVSRVRGELALLEDTSESADA